MAISSWDPGFVEILWSNYGYAPGESLLWPGNWPDFSSPLCRPHDDLIHVKMIFPSALVPQLRELFRYHADKRAVLISGKNMFGTIRWPLPGEKKWTSWED